MNANEGFLGVGWPAWGRCAAWTWVVLFVSVWVSLFWGWSGGMTGGMWLSGIALGAVAVANCMPGAVALLSPALRRQLAGSQSCGHFRLFRASPAPARLKRSTTSRLGRRVTLTVHTLWRLNLLNTARASAS